MTEDYLPQFSMEILYFYVVCCLIMLYVKVFQRTFIIGTDRGRICFNISYVSYYIFYLNYEGIIYNIIMKATLAFIWN